MTWTGFAAVFIAFFLTHSIPVRPKIKAYLTVRLGNKGFTLAYSAVSLAMLTLLIWAAGQAPFVMLWPQFPWTRHAAHIGMLAVCLILALSLGRPNPFSFGGIRNDRFDPTRPGLVRWTRHPVLLSLALWAGVHLLPNGDLAHTILFGVLGGFALFGQILINIRKRRVLGDERWSDLQKAVSKAPRWQTPASWFVLAVRLILGAFAFLTLVWLHPLVIGVPAV